MSHNAECFPKGVPESLPSQGDGHFGESRGYLLYCISTATAAVPLRRPLAMADPDGAKLDLRTVFVKGVSFDSNDKDFEEALSNIGPLRKCFLLKGAGKNHKVYFVAVLYIEATATHASPLPALRGLLSCSNIA